jgi:hypothetical protein
MMALGIVVALALLPLGAEAPMTGPDSTYLFRFSVDAPEEWLVVNDGVMGGLSRSEFVTSADGHATFRGEMSLENNGGFASVRGYVPEGIPPGARALEIRVRGDGRTYQLRLRMGRGFDGVAYATEFATEPDTWQTIELPLAGFAPTFRGRRPRNPPPLELEAVRQLGLMIADKREGAFRLDVEWVRVAG